ncbi:MAG: hypothetical protein WA803_10950 [Steroidobacteraceae bacterium]
MSATHRLLSAGLLWAAMTSLALAQAPVPTSAIVSVVEGPPFSLIRGVTIYTSTRGVVLLPGDVIESSTGNLLILELRTGAATSAVVAIGPVTRAYWINQPGGATFAVLDGWVKVDTASVTAAADIRTVGTRLGAASDAGTYVLHAGDSADEVFHERGAVTLWVPAAGGWESAPSNPSEFAARTQGTALRTQIGLEPAFLRAMPSAFRDPLPLGMSASLHTAVEPQALRDVAYEDVANWLTAPLEWRRGFTHRFRPRLKDPAFYHALDAHLSAHPEWAPILRAPHGQ